MAEWRNGLKGVRMGFVLTIIIAAAGIGAAIYIAANT
jgi:phage shock protein PspC (stress-responsive transcriptional regulator)